MEPKQEPKKPPDECAQAGAPSRRRWQWWLFRGWIALCVAILVVMGATRPWGRLSLRFINSQAIEELGGAGYVAFDLWDSCRGYWRSLRLSSIDVEPYRAYLLSLAARRRPVPPPPVLRKHIVYVQMESADGLVIGARYQGRPLMPFLESLARKEVYFSNVVDNSAGGRTTSAEVMVLTSLVPLRRAPAYVSQPLDQVPSMPRVLKAAGYDTWSMHGYDGAFWRRKHAHEALGFEAMFFRDDLDGSEQLGWGVSDRSVLHQAARRIIAARRPTFAHVILLTNHHPFTAVREAEHLPAAGIVADYVYSARYMDECIKAFFDELAAAGVLQDCIVAIYGDHDSSITAKLERRLQDVPTRLISDTVPLIIAGLPEAPRRIEAVAGLQDVPVIMLEAVGLPVPLTFTGNSLGGQGRTVAALYGALESTPRGLVAAPMPVDQETLTLLELRHPEKLLAP